MGRVTPFTKVPSGDPVLDRLQDRLSEALRVVRQSPQALVTARGSIVAATGDGAPAEHQVGADGTLLRAASTEDTGLTWGAALPFLNVLDYGADSTGAISSTAAVTAALAALPTAGGRIWFPPGKYKVNISTTRYGVVFMGSGAGNINTGLGGTELVADNAASPVIQIGDGAVTTCRGNRVQDMILTGDNANATGDGIYLFGARDVVIDNVAITAYGRDDVRIRSNTAPSSGIYLKGCALAGGKHASLYAEYGASFVTHVVLDACHINSPATAGSYAVLLDSVVVWMLGTYLDLHDGATGGHVAMVNNFASNPGIIAQAAAFDNGDGPTAVSLDVSTVFAKAARLSSAISGSYTFNGKVIYSDGTIQQTTSCNAQLYQSRLLNARILNALYMPLDETDINTTVTFSRSGATADTDAQVILAHSALKITGASTSPLQIGTSALYKNSNSLLMWRKDSSFPTAENNAQPLGWLSATPSTASTTITIDLTTANVFYVIVATSAVHTIANPSGSGTGVASHGDSLLEIWIDNTSGGALGVFTWSGNYHFVGGLAPDSTVTPATGKRMCVQFRQYSTGSPWYEVRRSTGDITT
jgi:hypothetical protein